MKKEGFLDVFREERIRSLCDLSPALNGEIRSEFVKMVDNPSTLQ
jgi:hypothetical protein